MRQDATETNKDKLTQVLRGYEKKHEQALHQMESAHLRLQGAEKGVLKRRFIFDITNLHDRINKLRGQILWAERMLETITTALNAKKQAELDEKEEARVMKECTMSEDLKHSPFKQLQVG